jgi:hypothetical protein
MDDSVIGNIPDAFADIGGLNVPELIVFIALAGQH